MQQCWKCLSQLPGLALSIRIMITWKMQNVIFIISFNFEVSQLLKVPKSLETFPVSWIRRPIEVYLWPSPSFSSKPQFLHLEEGIKDNMRAILLSNITGRQTWSTWKFVTHWTRITHLCESGQKVVPLAMCYGGRRHLWIEKWNSHINISVYAGHFMIFHATC